MTKTATRRGRREGQTLVLFALFLVVLLGATGIAVDYGSWLKVRRDYQNVADAASLAGSVLLVRPITTAKRIEARKAAWKSIKDQLGLTLNEATLAATDTATGPGTGYFDATTGFRIWVSTPPLGSTSAYSGSFAGSNRVLFAWIEKDNPAFFSRILGIGDQKISAWATSGTFPNRFAVITLRKNGQPTNGNPTDFDINGGTVLNVVNGDVGGNWGMSINGSGSQIRMTTSTLGDAYGVYLTENVPTGGNGWAANQVVDGAGTPISVQYSAEVTDPNYPPPCLTFGVGGGSCLEERAVGPFPPNATTVRVGDTCPYTSTNVDRLPAGRYKDITIPNGKCLVLDPTFNPVTGKENGIFYITGTLDINNSGLLMGDGVTLVFDRNAGLNMNAGASISLNSGNTTNNPLASTCGGIAGGGITNCRFGGWTAKAGAGGTYTWSIGTSPTYSVPGDPFERGIAAYVCKTVGPTNCGSGGSPSTNILQMNSSSGIDYRGMIYAPFDNVKVAGQPTHSDIGQLVSWTAQFTGGSTITQTFDGPDSGIPVLLEPHLGQ
jgi:hypothetical protein